MDTPPTDENAEETSAELEKIFGKISAPAVDPGVFGDIGIPASEGPVPDPPPGQPVQTPAVGTDVVADLEAKSKYVTNATQAKKASQVVARAEALIEEQNKLPPRQQLSLKARTDLGVNWSAAFLLYAKGITLQQIATEFDITYTRLLERANKEDWDTLVKKHAGTLVAPPPKPENVQLAMIETEKRMKRVVDNREKNYSAAEALREDIMNVIATYRNDNQFLRPDDIATLAKALKITAEISMLTLGDEFVLNNGKPGGGGGGGGGNMRPIIINLPSAVAYGKDMKPALPSDTPEPPPAGAEADAEAVIELAVVGKTRGDKEAKPAPSGRGCGVNFDALPKIK